MPKIEIRTEINADKQIVFDLSRSIDLHKISTEHTNEEAISGKTSGLIGMNESVTWRAKHFGIYQNLTSKITKFDRPNYFVDEMQKGAFKEFKHEHLFKESNGGTLMTDIFNYQSPLGILGKLADKLFLEKYMTELLIERNRIVKEFSESEKWKILLNENKKFDKKQVDNDIQKDTERLHYIEKSNDFFSIQVNRNLNGRKMEKSGKIESAIQEYEKNINEGFEGNYPYDRLAIIYRKNKDYNNEIRILKKGIYVFSELSKTSQRGDLKPKLEKFKDRLEKSEKLKNVR